MDDLWAAVQDIGSRMDRIEALLFLNDYGDFARLDGLIRKMKLEVDLVSEQPDSEQDVGGGRICEVPVVSDIQDLSPKPALESNCGKNWSNDLTQAPHFRSEDRARTMPDFEQLYVRERCPEEDPAISSGTALKMRMRRTGSDRAAAAVAACADKGDGFRSASPARPHSLANVSSSSSAFSDVREMLLASSRDAAPPRSTPKWATVAATSAMGHQHADAATVSAGTTTAGSGAFAPDVPRLGSSDMEDPEDETRVTMQSDVHAFLTQQISEASKLVSLKGCRRRGL